MKFFKNFTLKIVKKKLFYKRSPPNIILIEITKLFLLLFGVCVCVYNLSNKKNVCICVCGSCLEKYIRVKLQLGPLKQKFLAPRLNPGNYYQIYESEVSHFIVH